MRPLGLALRSAHHSSIMRIHAMGHEHVDVLVKQLQGRGMTLEDEVRELVEAFVSISSQSTRAAFLDFVQGLDPSSNPADIYPKEHSPKQPPDLKVQVNAKAVDELVGKRVRERREALGISQGRLGRALGVTFSQIQSYERARNRIGAGRLYQIAYLFGVTPNFFFDLPEAGSLEELPRADRSNDLGAPSNDEVCALTDAFMAIEDEEKREMALALVRTIVEPG